MRRELNDRGQVLSAVVAGASVVVLLAALIGLFVNDDSDASEETAGTPSALASIPLSTSTGTDPTSPTPPASTARPPRGQTPAPKPTKSTAAEPTNAKPTKRAAKAPPTKQHPPPVPEVYVEVYNNSSIEDLAASTAARLQDAGWQVVASDNWYGAIPQSTVYYPSHLQSEAEQLARALGVGRTWPAISPMRFDRLTVILTG